MDDEGSRLPLLIVIALLVLMAFGGVVYLAYTEGVQKGRSDAPRVITAQTGPAKIAPTDAGGTETPYKGLKIYEQPAPSDEDSADQDSAPLPPTEVTPSKSAQAAPAQPVEKPAPVIAAPVTPDKKVAAEPTQKPAPAPVPDKKVAAEPAAAKPVPADKKVAALTPPPAKSTPAPAVTAAAKPPVATAAPKALTTAAAPGTTETKTPPAATTAAATTPKTTAAAPATSTGGGSYVLQIGAYKSEAEATAVFNALKAKNGSVMGGYAPNIRQVDLGAKGTWYRLRVGSFGDKDSANAVCQRLGGGCFPAKP
jgi:hypothetical protein